MPKRQRVHATIELALRDARIEREDKILQKLKLAVRQSIPQGRTQLNSSAHPALYTRFRGRGFPLKNLNNRKLPQWRSLSQWMKAQLTALCIAQFEHRQIRVRLHDDVRNREEAKGTDLKVYIRDRITRTLGEGFGEAPWYLFVIEDLDKDGKTLVRPHAHGIMRVRPLSLEKVVNQKSRTGYERSAASIGRDKAELRAGIAATRQLLNQATGNGQHSRREVGGISQKGNVWMREPYHVFFNDEAISYAFKNADEPMSKLPSSRLAISRPARMEAERLWELIRTGEAALDQWDL